jgi:hypothetical protein
METYKFQNKKNICLLTNRSASANPRMNWFVAVASFGFFKMAIIVSELPTRMQTFMIMLATKYPTTTASASMAIFWRRTKSQRGPAEASSPTDCGARLGAWCALASCSVKVYNSSSQEGNLWNCLRAHAQYILMRWHRVFLGCMSLKFSLENLEPMLDRIK